MKSAKAATERAIKMLTVNEEEKGARKQKRKMSFIMSCLKEMEEQEKYWYVLVKVKEAATFFGSQDASIYFSAGFNNYL